MKQDSIENKTAVTLEIPDQLFIDMIQNFPEAAQYAFECTDYRYHLDNRSVKEQADFAEVDLTDNETGVKYTLTVQKMREGFAKMLPLVLNGELPGLSLGVALLDASNWDSYALDALVQFALLGECIYG